MNDSDDYNSADDKSETTGADDTKPNKAGRTSDIYERFLNRVQQIDSDAGQSDIFDKPSSYEPLSEEELRLFSDFEPDYDSDSEPLSAVVNSEHTDEEDISADHTLNKSDSEQISDSIEADAGVGELADSQDNSNDEDQDNGATVAPPNAPNDVDTTIDNKLAKKPEKAKKIGAVRGRQVSSVKLLIVGVVCGLLLSTVIVVVLNSTGVLSALTDSLSANNPEPVSTSAPAAPVAKSSTEEIVNQEASADTIVETTVIPPEQSVAATGSDSTAINNKTTVAAEQVTEAKTNDANITYEDFREEAQNTLYRETND